MTTKSKHMRMDQIDQQILSELRQNCRRSYRELASSLKISPASLIERMRKLEKQGVITGYSASFDYLKLGYEFAAIAHISISGDVLLTQKKIGKTRGVAEVYDTAGQYNTLAVLRCKTREELSALLKTITEMPEVEKAHANLVLNIIKN